MSLVASRDPLFQRGESHRLDGFKDQWAPISQENNPHVSISRPCGRLNCRTLPGLENLENNVSFSDGRSLRRCVRACEKQKEEKEANVSGRIHVRAAHGFRRTCGAKHVWKYCGAPVNRSGLKVC
jgi:hypothetical protein